MWLALHRCSVFTSRIFKRAFSGVAAALCIGFISLSGSAHGAKSGLSGSETGLFAGSTVPPQVRSILQRSCQDCHSDKTEWPWYAYVPPVSWELEKDVSLGRAFMNCSRWSEYSDAERHGFMVAIGAATKGGVMPPPKYVWIHGKSRLSDMDLKELQRWVIAETRARSRKLEGSSR
jgi:hypothetical protein